jgi:lysophospholipase L1-like esterase
MGYLEDGNVTAATVDYDPHKSSILLIGDSIRLGYCKTVREQLADVANVFYPTENCRNTQYVITKLYAWSNEYPADEIKLVQFNCGHWDIAHWNGYEESLTTLAEYRRNIKMIIHLLRKLFPKAKLVFATTTAMNPNGSLGVNPRSNDEIVRYNRVAVEVAENSEVTVNDLNAITATYPAQMFRDYCHLTEAAFAELGKAVAGFLRQML